MRIGFVVEDDSDFKVMRILTQKLLPPDTKVGFDRRKGNGCSDLQRKCRQYAISLLESGCQWLVVVHDLDKNNEEALRANLNRHLVGIQFKDHIILIPRTEIESWLLCDGQAIARVFSASSVLIRTPGQPEQLSDPKKYLKELVRKKFSRVYVNTIFNDKIAQHMDIGKLGRCPSFGQYPSFVKKIK